METTIDIFPPVISFIILEHTANTATTSSFNHGSHFTTMIFSGRVRSLVIGLLSLNTLAHAKNSGVRGKNNEVVKDSSSGVPRQLKKKKKKNDLLSDAVEVMTQRDEGTPDRPSTCFNLLEQHWTLVMDFRTVGMIASAMIVDFPKGAGFKPGPHVHCGLSETFVAIKPESGPGSETNAYWMYEKDGTMVEHAVEDGDVLASPMGRIHTYYTRTPELAQNKTFIPLVDPKYWSRHLVLKMQGHGHQRRAEMTGTIEGNCEPQVNNIGADLSLNGGRAGTKNYDKSDPGFIVRVAALNNPVVPLQAPENLLVVDSETSMSKDKDSCAGLVKVKGSKAIVDMKDIEDAYSLTKCYMDKSGPAKGSKGVAVADVGHAVFLFVKKGMLSIATGTGEKTAGELDGVTVPADSGGYKASCVSSDGCEVWKFIINTDLNIAKSPHFGIDANKLVTVEQSDYGKKNYESYQMCAGPYNGTEYVGGEPVHVPVAVNGSTGELL